MASLDLHEKAHFTRLSRLLVDKGTEALRNTFDGIHSPANLPAVLSANKTSLLKLKPRVINDFQWDLLYPSSGNPPDSKTFDVTLLTVLFRNICGLPTTGWGVMPANSDRSMQANIVRIRLFRNDVYAHVTSTQVDNATFESLWTEISQALVDLNIPQKDIDELKACPLGPREEECVEMLKDWNSHEKECLIMLESIDSSIHRLTQITEDGIKHQSTSQEQITRFFNLSNDTNIDINPRKEKDENLLRKLAKHNFKSKIRGKVKYFLPGTREWLLKKVDQWFNEDKEESRILLLTAGPGFGKSVFLAKVCEDFKKQGKLGACHFCDFSDSNLRNPMMMLQSLASQMCENVVGFEEKLIDQLKRPHEVRTLKDAFGIYLQNPLDELELAEPILIVIDGLDECAADNKNEIVKLIANYFPDLPQFVKVLVASRPEISVAKLSGLRKIDIGNSDVDNNSDLKIYLKSCLPSIPDRASGVFEIISEIFYRAVFGPRIQHRGDVGLFEKLVEKCEGSFLYAFFVQSELKKRDDLDQLLLDEITNLLPEGLGSIYEVYFRRLEKELKAIMEGNFDVFRVLEMLVASKGPLPLTIISDALGLAPDCRDAKNIINRVNEAVSCLLYVSDDHVTVFHKSVVDWLLAKGYKDHEYTVKVIDGDRLLWVMCEQMFEEIKKTVCSGHDLKLTDNAKYALRHGFHHLTSCEKKESYTWLVDVVIVYVLLTISQMDLKDMLKIWKDVLRVNPAITDGLRARISWHFVETEFVLGRRTFPNLECPMYLTSVLAHSPKGYFSENERNIAKSLLSKFLRLVDVNYDRQVNDQALAVYSAQMFEAVTAIGLSIYKSMAAVAHDYGNITLLELPSLEELWQYRVDHTCIPCCTFAPDGSLVLFGKLGTALSVAERKKVPFFHDNKETFVSCGFSPNGKRLVTSNGSSTVKLWDIADESLLSLLSTEIPVSSCSFSRSGLFIIANDKSDIHDLRDWFCVWNAVTWQRCDERNETGKARVGKLCKRCFPPTFELPAFKRLNIKPCRPLPSCKVSSETWSTGIFNEVECHFGVGKQSLSVVEDTHFRTLACWNIEIYEPCCFVHGILGTMTTIDNDFWLYANGEKLVVFRATQERSSGMPYPVLVYSISFSPDGSRLATCTSDGFVNVWNVGMNQVDQRFKCNPEESTFVCWWSKRFLFVFHVLEGIPTLSKYPMNANLELFPPQRDVLHYPSELIHLSTVIDFSEGFLVFKCRDTNTVSVLDVEGSRGLQMVAFPEIEPNMEITVSPRCSFVIGFGESMFYIWKRNRLKASVYDVFYKESLRMGEERRDHCCFSGDSKVAVIARGSFLPLFRDQHFQIFDLDTGNYKKVDFNFPLFDSKLFCFGRVVVCTTESLILIFDMDSGVLIEKSFQRYLRTMFLRQMEFSPKDSTLAIPAINGDIEFLRFFIMENPLLPTLKAKAAIEWEDKKRMISKLMWNDTLFREKCYLL